MTDDEEKALLLFGLSLSQATVNLLEQDVVNNIEVADDDRTQRVVIDSPQYRITITPRSEQ